MSDEKDIAAFKEKLDANHNWPEVYMFKFIVKGSSQKIAKIEAMFETDTSSIQLKNSSRGTYVSVTVKEVMSSAQEVVEIYREVRKIEGVMAL